MAYKELFVLRHAKSSWDEPNKDDIDRALTSRGIGDAYTMSHRLIRQLKAVDLILTSHANRAAHTSTIFAGVIGYPFDKIRITSSLYEASEAKLISVVKEFPDELTRVLIVGHNPTFTYFVNRYLPKSIDNIPTTGIVGMSFNASSWKQISKENLQSTFFEFPKKDQ